MRVLVTGSFGYIGSVLAPVLADAGHEVSGLDTDYYRGCSFGDDLGHVPTAERDIRDVGPADFDGFDAVVHLAALSNDPVGELDPSLTIAINHSATLNVARAAREAGVRRFIFASSCSMYGASDSGAALTESAPLRPITAYAESKVRSEEGLLELSGPDFAVVSMRNATVYGVSPRLRLDIVLNNLAAWSHTTGRIRLMSDGRSWRPLVHVRDLARTAAAMLDADESVIRSEAFNVGSDAQNYLIRDLAEVLSELTGCEVEMAEGAAPDKRSYRVDFSKLEAAFPNLDFEWDARSGARELLAAYEAVGLTGADFEGDRYVRLRRITHLVEGGDLGSDLRWAAALPSTSGV
jgi:nucleoside-diphosphate-sugar epimerase